LIMVLVWLKWDKLIRLSLKLFRLNLKENELLSVLDLQKKTRLNLAAVGLSSLVWALDILRLKLIALVFGWHPSLTLVAVISLANLVFGLLAFTPGGVGIVEGGLTGVLLYLGVPLPLSLSVTLLERFISYGLSTVVGFMVLATSGGMEIWKALR
ncbi:flippase-like domain-containing protein, partial [Thermosulfurimonas sp.]|uniref:lysylphosphatidylglycerol synthase transmembrane domain-containing protein n=1 Tax=Thermosulfurimonas sp. TaxID=2080236 RepID=UPI0025D7757A